MDHYPQLQAIIRVIGFTEIKKNESIVQNTSVIQTNKAYRSTCIKIKQLLHDQKEE